MTNNEEEINILSKAALKSDFSSLEKVLKLLEKYEKYPFVKFGMYSLLFQVAFNINPDTSKICEQCGGKCCKTGYPIPVFKFDYEEIKKYVGDISLRKYNDIYLLSRPCQFQKGWMCTIHQFKPYACLCFPFATEDEQVEIINNYDGRGIPNFKIPEYCIAGKIVVETLAKIIAEFRQKYNRDPSPIELYKEIKEKYTNLKSNSE